MSWTLTAYIGRRYAGALAAVVAVVFTLVLLINFIEMLRRDEDDAIPFLDILAMAAFQTPGVALAAAPFAVLLAALSSLARLARASEIVVARAAGVSIWALMAAPAAIAFLAGVLTFAALNPIAAATTSRFETLSARSFKGTENLLSLSREGLWLRQGGERGQIVIHAATANADATRLVDVELHLFDMRDGLIGRIDAAEARLEDGAWRLIEARRRVILDEGDALAAAEPPEPQTITVPTDLTSDQILDSFAPPERISFWNLPRFIETFEEAGFSADRHRLYWHSQLSTPVLFAAMTMIGGAFAMRHARLGGLGWLALAAVGTGLGLYFVTDLSKALGASGSVPPMLGAWAPPLAATLIAMALMLHFEEE